MITNQTRIDGLVGPERTRYFLAVCYLHRTHGRCTVRMVAKHLDRNHTSSWKALVALRALGLITWDDDHCSTIRPLIGPVPFGESS